MKRDLSRLTSAEHDVVVIGGGIHGLAIAYDAAQRGLAVALIERGDFGGATSFSHLKTVHGGLRYLQSADFSRMRESITERRTFARIAPHLVKPLPFVMPTFAKLTRSRLAMSVAFRIDAMVASDRNAGLGPRHRLPAGHVISRDECVRLFGGSTPRPVTGGALWYDYQMVEADRLTLGFGLAADAHGAALANYVEAVEPIRDGSRMRGVRARDTLTGELFDIKARLVVNAAGPWAADLLERWALSKAWPLLKTINVVVKRPPTETGLVGPTPQGRALVLVPWHDRVVVGTGESSRLCSAGEQAVSTGDLEQFLEEANGTFPAWRIEPRDVTLVHRGVVPAAVRKGRLGLEGHSQVRDHAADGLTGLISIVGVKYTTARYVAQRTVDLAVSRLGKAAAGCRTASEPLPGADAAEPESAARELAGRYPQFADAQAALRLVQLYGTAASGILDLAATDATLGARIAPSVPVLRAEIVHAVRTEMALTLTDVVVRRTALGAAGHPGGDVAGACADLLQAECRWPADRRTREIEALNSFYSPVPA
jgi:glycerol-3-phosphate dehydrogenase